MPLIQIGYELLLLCNLLIILSARSGCSYGCIFSRNMISDRSELLIVKSYTTGIKYVYVFSWQALPLSFGDYPVLFVSRLPKRSWFVRESKFLWYCAEFAKNCLKTTCGRSALSALLFVGSTPGLMMKVNQYSNPLRILPMNFWTLSQKYSISIQCRSSSRWIGFKSCG